MKTCKLCGETKVLGEFYRRGDGRTRTECRTCNTRKQREFRASNPEWVRAYAKKRYALNPESAKRRAREYREQNLARVKAQQRTKATGWTAEQFGLAWAAQDGRCAICCAIMLPGGKFAASATADHNHATGRPRGILCSNCNRGLGLFGESVERLRAACAYLGRYA